jgi:hypothetical protein
LAAADLGLVAVIVNDIGETRINTNTVAGIQLHIVRGWYKSAAVVHRCNSLELQNRGLSLSRKKRNYGRA